MTTIFLRALKGDDKAAALRAAIGNPEAARGKQRYEVNTKIFASVPGSPFCYWVGDRLRSVFSKFPPLERGRRAARAGGQTSDDVRYLRSYWEIGQNSTRNNWHTYVKGGRATKFYVDQVLVAPWDVRRSTFPGFLGRPGRASEKPSNYELYFRPGLTWPLRASAFSPQVMPAGCIFTVRSYAIVDDRQNLLALLAVLASSAADYIAKLLLGRFGFPEFVVGVLQKLPIPDLSGDDAAALDLLARRAWSLQRSLDMGIETSHAFTLPALLSVEGDTFTARVGAWAERVRTISAELVALQSDIDLRSFALYGIDESDRRVIVEGFDSDSTALDQQADDEDGEDGEDGEEDEYDTNASINSEGLIADLVSWAVGVAVGRFDVRLATGVRTVPAEPEPFDQLPICSPAALIGDDNKPSACAPVGYPLSLPESGILVNDAGHPRDLSSAVRAVFDAIFGATGNTWWNEAAAVLNPKSHDLYEWLGANLFEHHLKLHSKSGRKAPILWQLATPSGRYSVWLYAHRLTRDSFFQIQNDVVAPKLAHEERTLTNIVEGAGSSPSAVERREIAEQEAFVGELRSFLDEVKRVSPLWNPFFDDGTALTMAPLWRLVPHHKPWQKELKNKWDDLVAGKFEWAHVAMHLWPERVVPKCASDRSYAIAHRLEDAFWVEGLSGHWRQRLSIADTVRYLEENLYSETLRQTVSELFAFSQERATTSGDGPGWWTALSMGAHDDLALALALWPERVLRKAVADPTRFTILGIKLPRARTEEELLAKLLNTRRPRLLEHQLQILGEFCGYPGDRDMWRQRWAEFAAGIHDDHGLARAVHTSRVVAKAQANPDFAELHDLFRWFWLVRDSGPCRLKEPPEETAEAVRVRTSFAVKAALKSLLQAPSAAAGGGRGRARQATTAAADGETV